MTRYFMHLRDGVDESLDEEGYDYADLPALKTAMMQAARDVMAGDVCRGRLDLRCRIDAEDAAGMLIDSLPFDDAVTIFPPHG